MGLKYGCPVEDVITGLSIQCRGWKSIYFCPEREGFLGVSTTTLDQTLVQHKRWSEGDLQILLSEYSPLLYGVGKINSGLIMGYCVYCMWSLNCFATLFYSIVPPLYLLNGIPLFPQVRWCIDKNEHGSSILHKTQQQLLLWRDSISHHNNIICCVLLIKKRFSYIVWKK